MVALKSTAVSAWAKSKDAAGHEHGDDGKFTSGGGGGGAKPAGEGRLYATRRGAGESDEETKRRAAATRARNDADFGAKYLEGDEAVKELEKIGEPALAEFGQLARDIVRANTPKREDVVWRFKPKTGVVSITRGTDAVDIPVLIESRDGGVLVRGRRNVLVPYDATEEEASRLIHRAMGYKPPGGGEKPASNLPAGKSAAAPANKLP